MSELFTAGLMNSAPAKSALSVVVPPAVAAADLSEFQQQGKPNEHIAPSRRRRASITGIDARNIGFPDPQIDDEFEDLSTAEASLDMQKTSGKRTDHLGIPTYSHNQTKVRYARSYTIVYGKEQATQREDNTHWQLLKETGKVASPTS